MVEPAACGDEPVADGDEPVAGGDAPGDDGDTPLASEPGKEANVLGTGDVAAKPVSVGVLGEGREPVAVLGDGDAV